MPEAAIPTPSPVPPRHHWYELDFLVPYRDLILALGFFLFEAGVFLIPGWGVEAGLMTTGIGLMVAAWRILQKT